MAKTFRVKDMDFRPGDVIVTKNGAMADLLGHAAMVIDSKRIVNVTGYGDHTHYADIDDYVRNSSSGGWIKLYRANDYYEGANAAKWMDRTYGDYQVPYHMTTNLNSTDVTYCTKMIVQAYHFGNKSGKIKTNYGFIEPFRLIEVIEKEGFSMAFMGYLEP